MGLKVTVLGSSGGYAGPGKACSGYLLEGGKGSLVLDLGAGALSNLLKYVPADEVGGLALTHMHYDHYVDIYGLCTARRFWEYDLPPLPLLAPSNAPEVIKGPLQEGSRDEFMRCLDVREAYPGAVYTMAGCEITALPAEHMAAGSFIYRLTCEGQSICYTGDTDFCEALLEQARGVDLLICEATFTSQVPEKMHGHLYAAEAGRAASEAGAVMLLLTHIWPTLSAERALEDARAVFDGRCGVAVEGSAIEL
ncbi:MAG: MBL fold metallo-hydrolase [Actinomycetota bacterium]